MNLREFPPHCMTTSHSINRLWLWTKLPGSTQTLTSTTTWVEISFNLQISNHPPHPTVNVRYNSKRLIRLHLKIKQLNPNLNPNLNRTLNPNRNPKPQPQSQTQPQPQSQLNLSLAQLQPQLVLLHILVRQFSVRQKLAILEYDQAEHFWP